MKITTDMIRRLQKDGEFRFDGLTREQSREAATRLAQSAMQDDAKHGVASSFGISRDAFGYYRAAVIN